MLITIWVLSYDTTIFEFGGYHGLVFICLLSSNEICLHHEWHGKDKQKTVNQMINWFT